MGRGRGYGYVGVVKGKGGVVREWRRGRGGRRGLMGEMGVVRGKVGVAVGKGAWLGRRWAWPRLKGRGHGIGAFSEGGGRGLMG